MGFRSEGQAMTVPCSSSLPRSSYCHWRMEDAVISLSRRRPKGGRRWPRGRLSGGPAGGRGRAGGGRPDPPPLIGPLVEGEPAGGGVEVAAVELGRLDLDQEPFGLPLGAEAAGSLRSFG